LLVEPYESDRGANLAGVAFSAQLGRLLRLGEPVGTAGAVSAAGSTGRPLGVPARVNRWPDEADARNEHVRICGSPGWVTAQGDPARRTPQQIQGPEPQSPFVMFTGRAPRGIRQRRRRPALAAPPDPDPNWFAGGCSGDSKARD